MNVPQICEEIKNIIDALWAGEIDEKEAAEKINTILAVKENRVKIFRDRGEKSPTFERLVGKKRIKTFDFLLALDTNN